MADSAYAFEHAQEVFKSALEKKELNKWQSDLRRIAGLVKDSALLRLLEDPKGSIDEKTKVLSERLIDVSPNALKLLAELMTKGKLSAIEDIAEEYQRLLDNHHGIEGTETAEVTTAIALEDDYILKLAKRLTDMSGKPVIIKTKVDPSLIGGIVIRLGDQLIDGSIRSKLAALKRDIDIAIR